MSRGSNDAIEDIDGSPIVGRDELPIDIGRTEMRRARATVEICYRAEPDEFVDIQALMLDALTDVGRGNDPDLGDVLATVDLTEHVRFVTP